MSTKATAAVSKNKKYLKIPLANVVRLVDEWSETQSNERKKVGVKKEYRQGACGRQSRRQECQSENKLAEG